MYWITNALYVGMFLSAVACSWHFACSSWGELLTRRLRKRFPHVKFV